MNQVVFSSLVHLLHPGVQRASSNIALGTGLTAEYAASAAAASACCEKSSCSHIAIGFAVGRTMSLSNVFDDEAECLFSEDYQAFVEDQLFLLQGSFCSQADSSHAKQDCLPVKRLSSISLAAVSTTADTDDEWQASARPSTESNLSLNGFSRRQSAPSLSHLVFLEMAVLRIKSSLSSKMGIGRI